GVGCRSVRGPAPPTFATLRHGVTAGGEDRRSGGDLQLADASACAMRGVAEDGVEELRLRLRGAIALATGLPRHHRLAHQLEAVAAELRHVGVAHAELFGDVLDHAVFEVDGTDDLLHRPGQRLHDPHE